MRNLNKDKLKTSNSGESRISQEEGESGVQKRNSWEE